MPQVKSLGAASPPPDAAALLAAATPYTLPSGREVLWLAPDLETLMAFTGALPDPITSAVYHLLRDEGELEPKDDPRSYHRQFNQVRGMMAVAAAGLIRPIFDPDRTLGDGNGTIGRREMPLPDLEFCWYWLFRRATTPALYLAAAEQSGGVATATPAGEGVPPNTSDAIGDNGPGSGAGDQLELLHGRNELVAG